MNLRARRGGHNHRIPPLVLASALAALLTIVACSRDRGRTRPNLLVVVIDTCRVDRMSLYGYEQPTTPNLEKLAAQAVVFTQAVSHVPQTLPSVSTLLTSTPPREHGVRVNGLFQLPAAFETLAEVLRGQGYVTAGVVSAFPLDARFGIDQGFDFYDADFRESILTRTRADGFTFQGTVHHDFEQRADEATDKALKWLGATTKQSDRPVFLLVHYFDPHYPYEPPADRVALPGYDGELAFVDAEIGRLVAGIRGLGRLDDTLVVVVGDHGELLDPSRPLARHAGYLEDAVLRVPLMMLWPRALPSGRRIDAQVGLLDVAPTVLDILKIPAPAQFRGRSLIPLVEGGGGTEERRVYFETLFWALEEKRGLSRYGVRTPKRKYILNLQTGEASLPKEELYDLEADPAEHENLLADPARSAAYGEALEPLRREVSARVDGNEGGERSTLSQGDEERLRALGYLGR
jgi:arylsulfatase A-like enzyme